MIRVGALLMAAALWMSGCTVTVSHPRGMPASATQAALPDPSAASDLPDGLTLLVDASGTGPLDLAIPSYAARSRWIVVRIACHGDPLTTWLDAAHWVQGTCSGDISGGGEMPFTTLVPPRLQIRTAPATTWRVAVWIPAVS